MRTIFNDLPSFFAGIFIAAIATTLLIYLTPLKHLNLVPPTMHEVDPMAFYKENTAHPDQYLFIDVRTPNEYAAAHPKGAINIPIEDLTSMQYQLPRSGKQIVLTCTTGRLAAIAYGYLEDMGFLNLLHLTGGLQQWALDGLPVEGTSVPASTNSLSLAVAESLTCPGA